MLQRNVERAENSDEGKEGQVFLAGPLKTRKNDQQTEQWFLAPHLVLQRPSLAHIYRIPRLFQTPLLQVNSPITEVILQDGFHTSTIIESLPRTSELSGLS